MSATHSPVLILGGGPGGCAAALRLAQLGVPAVLVEKSVFPRDKVCGDALSGKVMRTLERLDPALADRVRAEAQRMPSWGVVFVAPEGKALRVPFSREIGIGEAPGAILPRLDFDNILFQKVKATPGITVLEGMAAKAFERTAGGWRVSLALSPQSLTINDRPEKRQVASLPCRQAGWQAASVSVARTEQHSTLNPSTSQPPTPQPTSHNTPLILDASGANSTFARHTAGLPLEPRHHAAGVRAYYSGVKGLDSQGFIELIFLKELLPGYLWVFPLPDGRANVGLGLRSDVVRKRKADLKGLLLKLLSEHPALKDRFAHATLDGPIQGMGLPLASKRHPLSGDGYLLIGDAGHLIDPFTGEGISHAMISGVYAAEAAAEMLRQGSVTASEAKRYDTRVWQRLGQELAISSRLQQLAFRPWLFDFVVDRAMRNPALADTISSMFNDLDLRARLKKPGFYWDLLLGR